jgi:hypothetical protein
MLIAVRLIINRPLGACYDQHVVDLECINCVDALNRPAWVGRSTVDSRQDSLKGFLSQRSLRQDIVTKESYSLFFGQEFKPIPSLTLKAGGWVIQTNLFQFLWARQKTVHSADLFNTLSSFSSHCL